MADGLARARLKAQEVLTRARHGAARLRERGARVAKVGMRSLVSTGTAFGIGYLDGKAPTGEAPRVLGIPLETVIGLGAHAAGLAGGFSADMAEGAHAVGDGAIAVAGYKFGRETGQGRPR